jgi:tRNA(fMet)-specific endonuclease VapC
VVIYALDTNTVSYYMRRQGAVVEHLQSLPPQQIVLPALVVFEVIFGLRRAGRQGSAEAFDILLEATKLLDFDREAAEHAADIRVHLESRGTPIGLADLLIAATARRHGCTLVTHNTREFERVPDLLLDDWY